MIKYYSADYVLPVTGPPIPQGIVGVDEAGTILGVWKDIAFIPELTEDQIERHAGLIVPGFVNAHCHLELSHMKGLIPREKGLVMFLQHVIKLQKSEQNPEEVETAIRQAHHAMWDNGIVAVGDHVNTASTAPLKNRSELYYHTFLEILGFDPAEAERVWESAEKLAEQFEGLPYSFTPHAHYSVSRTLLRMIRRHTGGLENPYSIHNQESEAENEFFRRKNGEFLDFFESLGKDITHFKTQGLSALRTNVTFLPKNQRIQLVHNTFTSRQDAFLMHRMGLQVYWCLCPNANLYIEGRLPSVSHLLRDEETRMTIGTDSLASNDRLCILSELKTLHEHNPSLDLRETLKWATLNGAEFLGVSERFGSIEPGKQPGLNLLVHTNGWTLTEATTIKKLA